MEWRWSERVRASHDDDHDDGRNERAAKCDSVGRRVLLVCAGVLGSVWLSVGLYHTWDLLPSLTSVSPRHTRVAHFYLVSSLVTCPLSLLALSSSVPLRCGGAVPSVLRRFCVLAFCSSLELTVISGLWLFPTFAAYRTLVSLVLYAVLLALLCWVQAAGLVCLVKDSGTGSARSPWVIRATLAYNCLVMVLPEIRRTGYVPYVSSSFLEPRPPCFWWGLAAVAQSLGLVGLTVGGSELLIALLESRPQHPRVSFHLPPDDA